MQYSVFECDPNASERIKLEDELNEIINAAEDQVLFVSIGPAESRGARDIRAIGLPYLRLDEPCYVVSVGHARSEQSDRSSLTVENLLTRDASGQVLSETPEALAWARL